MVNKLCAMCGRYFAGDLNGDYLCSACASISHPAPAPSLSSLDGDVASGQEKFGAIAAPGTPGRSAKRLPGPGSDGGPAGPKSEAA